MRRGGWPPGTVDAEGSFWCAIGDLFNWIASGIEVRY
jgi:hypothetical protein